MSGPVVKICGLTRREDAVQAAKAGADMLGMVFAEKSKRKVDVTAAKEIVSFVRGWYRETNARRAQTPQCGPADQLVCPRFVGVFVNERVDEINRITEVAGLDLVQLHGDEEPSAVDRLHRPAIRAIRISTGLPDISVWSRAEWILFDAAEGGSGERFDWNLLARVRRPFLLAGGLTPDNLSEALAATGAAGVDVASGVESGPGVKDHQKVRRFVELAKALQSPHSRPPSSRGRGD